MGRQTLCPTCGTPGETAELLLAIDEADDPGTGTVEDGVRPAGNDFELAASCLKTLLGSWDRYHLDDENVTQRTIFVDTGSVSSVNFAVTAAEQQQLYTSGCAAETYYLQQQQTSQTVPPR